MPPAPPPVSPTHSQAIQHILSTCFTHSQAIQHTLSTCSTHSQAVQHTLHTHKLFSVCQLAEGDHKVRIACAHTLTQVSLFITFSRGRSCLLMISGWRETGGGEGVSPTYSKDTPKSKKHCSGRRLLSYLAATKYFSIHHQVFSTSPLYR